MTRAIDEPAKELTARLEREAGGVSIALDGQQQRIRFAVSGAEAGEELDYLLPLTLFPAMVRGQGLRLPGELSPRLLAAAPKIQDMFGIWCTEYWRGRLEETRHVPVHAAVRDRPVGRASGVACLFSGGVDSFYTLLKHRDEVTHIIFVHGFDVSLEDQRLRAEASRMAREVARELGMSLIEVETNLRAFSNAEVGWEAYHGAALAGIALLFQHLFCKVLIAATYTYSELLPLGSHPMLDPLWSTELTEIEHHGCEATRLHKTAYIAEHETAMRWLRVCLANPDGVYNCGRCEKCLRTMTTLRIAGVLERCETLPNDLNLDEVANTYIPGNRLVTRQNLRALESFGTDPELARALDTSLRASETAERETTKQLRQRLSQLRETLGHTRVRLEASREQARRLRTKAQRAEAKSEELTKQYRLLAARYSTLRYRIADAVAGVTLRIPGIRRLARARRSDNG